MNVIPESDRIAYQTRVLDLADSCPFSSTTPCTCPWHEIRGKSRREKYNWVAALSDDRILEILAFHKLCSERPVDSFIDKV